MPLPTLLTPGTVTHAGHEVPADIRAVDYIVGVLKRKMTEFGAPAPRAMSDRVFVIKSETGSGKSTALPAEIFHILRSPELPPTARYRGPSVVCTEPRVFNAKDLVRVMTESGHYPDLRRGVTVGYQTGDVNERPARGLIYATRGSFAMEINNAASDAEVCERYRFIILDEAHERSLDSDLLLYRLKLFMHRVLGRADAPFVILASATIHPPTYLEYFGIPPDNLIHVTGRSYPVPTTYLPAATEDAPREAAATVARLHAREDPPARGDILIFVPGADVAQMVRGHLEALNAELRLRDDPFYIITLNRQSVVEESPDFRAIWTPLEELGARRRVIVSTDVAETGVTIDSLKYVVDFGWHRGPETYFPERASTLVTKPAAISRARQRQGRAGRLFPGEYYPLYTESTAKQITVTQLPDIVTAGPEEIFLELVATQADDKRHHGAPDAFRIEDLDLLTPPPADALASCVEAALVAGFLDERAERLTPLGEEALRLRRVLPVRLEVLRLLMLAPAYGVAMPDAVSLALAIGGARAPQGGVRRGAPEWLGEKTLTRLGHFLADDFIDHLWFARFVTAVLRSGGYKELLPQLRAAGIEGRGVEDFTAYVQQRDAIENALISVGISPFGDITINKGALYPWAIRIKQLLYDSFPHAVLTYSAKRGGYINRYGALLATRRFDEASRPRQILAPAATFAADRIRYAGRKVAIPVYVYTAGPVSALDGFVAIDPALYAPAADVAADVPPAGTDVPPAGTDVAANTNAPPAGADVPPAGTDAAANTNAPPAGTDAAANTNAPPAGTDAAEKLQSYWELCNYDAESPMVRALSALMTSAELYDIGLGATPSRPT